LSRQIVNSFCRSLSIASAALVIHVGGAAAATPRSDFQRHVGAVLAGNSANSATADEIRLQSPALTWTLFQTPPWEWADGQPIGLLAALGPSNLRYGEVRGGRSPVDTAAPMVAGWTKPLGLRLAIRW
jgi:hypothetical protein